MARHDFKPTARAATTTGRKTGRGVAWVFVVGMGVGAILALGVTRWMSPPTRSEEASPTASMPRDRKHDQARPTKAADPLRPSPVQPAVVESVSPSPRPPVRSPVPVPVPTTPVKPTQPVKSPGFHEDLTHGRPPMIAPAIKPREIWWLQVAALGKDEDARRLRARVLLLNLDVVIVPPSPATGSLYRVRVGPYKTEALARAKEGVLMHNNLTPRIIKEPVFSP
jgi:cell division protein FtsN